MPPEILLVRHLMGDWSDMGKEDEATNWQSIDDASRILSAYQVGSHRFYVITEADRETTTILLAEEY
jgi:uncharacterized protein (DUF2252 family)